MTRRDHQQGSTPAQEEPFGPWNPGISSELPRALLGMSTVLNSQNSAQDIAEVESMAEFSGLKPHKIAEFRPERLVLHELLIRVMAELTIPDGKVTDDLGVNFRRMTTQILRNHIAPEMSVLCRENARVRADIQAFIDHEVAHISAQASIVSMPSRRGWRQRFSWAARRSPQPTVSAVSPEDVTMRALTRWRTLAAETSNPLQRACYKSLSDAGSAIANRQGTLYGLGPVLARLATSLASNAYCSEHLGTLLDPLFQDAARQEQYRLLPEQSRPIVMNTKGASASGKSSLRPLQKQLALRMGVDWRDFALISPDIWRKQLLDYSALGAASRYAGTLAAHEVEIVDRKLDRHVAKRASAGLRTHMLIDRFRFDSFAPDGAEDSATQLLTRFASEVHMFFMVTPPEATVVRAWYRGERVGRYKAVDDLLAHNIEAYSGIPGLFFRWAASTDKSVHFEFLDNSVAEGERPRTIAFGINDHMTVLDIDGLIDVDRFNRVNVDARKADEVFADPDQLAASRNTMFLVECIRRLSHVDFADRDSGRIYATFRQGMVAGWDHDAYERAVGDPDVRAAFEQVASSCGRAAQQSMPRPEIDMKTARTLGAWGGAPRAAG